MFDELDVVDEMDTLHFLKATRLVYYFSIGLECLMILLLLPQGFLQPEGFVDTRIVYLSLMVLIASQRLVLAVVRDYYKYQSGDLKRKKYLIINMVVMAVILSLAIFAGWKITNG